MTAVARLSYGRMKKLECGRTAGSKRGRERCVADRQIGKRSDADGGRGSAQSTARRREKAWGGRETTGFTERLLRLLLPSLTRQRAPANDRQRPIREHEFRQICGNGSLERAMRKRQQCARQYVKHQQGTSQDERSHAAEHDNRMHASRRLGKPHTRRHTDAQTETAGRAGSRAGTSRSKAASCSKPISFR